MKSIACVSSCAFAMLWSASGRAANDSSQLAAQLKNAKVTLPQGLTASASKGKPISAKFEIEDGKLQLSVYTAKGADYSEVIVDHNTGKVAKSEAITSGDDLAAAKVQAEAMSGAKTSLKAAVRKALKSNQGYRAVSVTPSMKDGHPSADVVLLKGTETKTVSQTLE